MKTPQKILYLSAVVLLSACTRQQAGLSAGSDSVAAVAPASQPTVGQEVRAVVANKVEVKFPSGGAVLTPEANRQLDLAARLFRDANPVVMFSTGYSDQQGDEYYNLLLSARRAEAVKRGLVARGLPANRLLVQALGGSDLAKPDEPLSADNRRVVVTWRLL
jgi:outer membrane protein OmpA-like peptidoglycan-associated protein